MIEASTPHAVDASPPSVPVLAGTIVWAVLALLGLGPLDRQLGLFETVFLLAPCILMPLGLGLLGDLRSGAPGGAEAWIAIAYLVWPFGLLALVLALVFDPGVVSGVFAFGWLAPTGLAALGGAFWLGSRRSFRAIVVVPSFALLYLVVGAAWFVAWRFGWHPLDFSDTIVSLTAVHFHVAGFGALVFVWALVRLTPPGSRGGRVAGTAGVGAVIGIVVTAAGFTLDERWVSALGGTLLASALLVVVALTATGIAGRSVLPLGARVLLGVSSLCAVLGMALALHYALGQWLEWRTLAIGRMVDIHGVANGLGFATLGLLGWSTGRDAVFAHPPPDRFA